MRDLKILTPTLLKIQVSDVSKETDAFISNVNQTKVAVNLLDCFTLKKKALHPIETSSYSLQNTLHTSVPLKRITHSANYIRLPRRSTATPHTSSTPRQPPLRLPGAHVATNSPVQETEGLGHDVSDVGQAQQHQGNPQDGVKDGHYFSPLCLGSDMAITCQRLQLDQSDILTAADNDTVSSLIKQCQY